MHAATTDEPAPAIWRVATLTLTILLLSMTVPATELAPEVPDPVGSAEAMHDCPVNITDRTFDRGPGPTDCLPCHEDCVPGTDPCSYLPDCDPDPGEHCRTVYKLLGDLGIYRTADATDCVPDPSTEPCDYAGQFISCPPPIPPVPSEPEVIDDAISFTVVHQGSVFGPAPDADAAQPFTVDGHVRNELAVPALLNVEASSQTPSVCSVGGFSTSADANQVPPKTSATSQEIRQRNYVLGPNTSKAGASGDAVSDLVGEEAVGFSAEVAPKQVGTCTVRYDAVVRTAAGDVQVDSYRASTDVQPFPDDEVDLGGWGIEEHDCDRLTGDNPGSQTVAAGEVGVEAILKWASACSDVSGRWAVMNLSYKAKGEAKWRELPGGKVDNPGTDRVEHDITLSEGEYRFRVQSVYLGGGTWTWGCLQALAAVGGAAAAPFVVALIVGGPVSKAVAAAAIIGAIAAAWWTSDDCHQHKVDDGEYFVPVEAVQQTSDPGTVCTLLGGTSLC